MTELLVLTESKPHENFSRRRYNGTRRACRHRGRAAGVYDTVLRKVHRSE